MNILESDRHEELVGTIAGNNSTTSVTDELRKFKELADEGIITTEEFEAKKKELLNL